jgi:shikimate dehydrogenase
MKSFALIGKPLGHSLSPQIHALIADIIGIPCSYTLRVLEPEQVRFFIRSMRAEGYDGLNVTIPHKLEALQSVDSLSPEAKSIGAVNTVELSVNGLTGHNTDYYGFGAMLRAAGIGAAGNLCVVLGSGGSARAVAAYLRDAGAAELLVASRDAAEAAARFPGIKTITYEELNGLNGGLMVNCTPLGMFPDIDSCPVSETVIGSFAAVADLVYNPRETRLLSIAAKLGCKRADGLYMLAAQAVKAQEIWQCQPMGAMVEQEVYTRLAKALGVAQ